MSDDEILNDDEDVTIEAEFSINAVNTDHNALTNRNIADQHTISAITGLQDALDEKASEEDLTDHINDTDNPHEVSKEQVGLGNVANVDTTNASNITSGTLSNDRLGTIPYSKLSGVASSSQGAKADSSAATIATYGNIVTHNVSEFATSSQGAKADSALQQSDVVNNVTSTTTNAPLSANMGKELQDQITNLKQRGRYLSVWDCSTGLAETTPTVNPYTYKAGDYFIVGVVSSGTNYRPVGATYDKDVPSTTVETGTVKVNDTYYYDGSSWTLLHTEQPTVAFSTLAGSPYDNTNLSTALNSKQANITSTAKLSSDLVDDTNHTNKFVTANEKTTWSNKQDALGYTAENAANKVTSVSSSSTDTQYPSAKCVYTIVGNIESAINTIRGVS